MMDPIIDFVVDGMKADSMDDVADRVMRIPQYASKCEWSKMNLTYSFEQKMWMYWMASSHGTMVQVPNAVYVRQFVSQRQKYAYDAMVSQGIRHVCLCKLPRERSRY